MERRWKIKLTAPEDVKEFVYSADKCDFDVDVSYNRFVIDAKSIMGVFSLDLSKILTVKYTGCNPLFEETLKKYCVA